MFGDLNNQAIEHLLKYQLLGHIGCHANDKTYIVPICYAYDDGCIYGRTFEGMKIRIMRENPKVCFQLEHVESMGKWQSVICWGEFEELTDKDKRDKGIKVLQNRVTAIMGDKNLLVSNHWPFALNDSDYKEGIIFCIHISEKTGKFEMI
ncbi:pyridoxamine 5'-phosphate oxidase family protein [Ginsengibacter hankyongi]|uniref:Pyridoxamine 5'-phosphate oxidase family protein n=1 Tax=Ginsengibacter hankyongi TaxID=2607284 RepID=A0A5J5IEV3_9BACT|nr:pyridoxamine 5'-phosphate oxidase family protein [Ginsengibacter hankyongi]KAA9038528.1 pyridoxamine 5'-phosphate oxidase family protein [Ginsengibacter hankyongi]